MNDQKREWSPSELCESDRYQLPWSTWSNRCGDRPEKSSPGLIWSAILAISDFGYFNPVPIISHIMPILAAHPVTMQCQTHRNPTWDLHKVLNEPIHGSNLVKPVQNPLKHKNVACYIPTLGPHRQPTQNPCPLYTYQFPILGPDIKTAHSKPKSPKPTKTTNIQLAYMYIFLNDRATFHGSCNFCNPNSSDRRVFLKAFLILHLWMYCNQLLCIGLAFSMFYPKNLVFSLILCLVLHASLQRTISVYMSHALERQLIAM